MKSNLSQVRSSIQSLAAKHKRSIKRAMQRALSTTYQDAWKIAKQRYPKLPKNQDAGKITSFKSRVSQFLQPASSEGSLSALLKASNRQFSVIHSVVGSPIPRMQKGVAVAKRRPVYVRVAGQKHKLGKAQFIAAPRKLRAQGVTQVFARGHRKRGAHGQGLLKLSHASVVDVLRFSENQEQLAASFEKTLTKALVGALSRLH